MLRLLRTERLSSVVVAFASDVATTVTDLWSLPLGAAAVELAIGGDPDLVPLVRDDVGGVLVGVGAVSPIQGTVYVDESRVLSGGAAHLLVEPDTEKGLAVTIVPRRRILGFGPSPADVPGPGGVHRNRAVTGGEQRRVVRPEDGSLDVLQAHRASTIGQRRSQLDALCELGSWDPLPRSPEWREAVFEY